MQAGAAEDVHRHAGGRRTALSLTVAASFYGGLTTDGGHLDTDLAARAARRRPERAWAVPRHTPSLWAASLHTRV
ncbi:hypothetical protein [Streptomyces sp. NPDC046712]|uniref:hypothetical protein n=1 Tax=Streptomyces sp. NPDC046712 TaxID=3154802 RepID=UPI0033FF2E69